MASEKTAIPLDVEKESVSPKVTGTASEEVLKHANDADDAMKAFAGHEGEMLVLDEATNKRLLRKIDMNLMPVCLHQRSGGLGLDDADSLDKHSFSVSSMVSTTWTVCSTSHTVNGLIS